MVKRCLEKLRPCGRLETFSTARHHLGFYKNVGFTAEYKTQSISETPLENQVYIALHHHPALSAIALNEDQSYPDVYFARLPEIDLRNCIEFYDRKSPFPGDGEADSELDELLTQQHSRDFKENLGSRPFWRLLVTTLFTATWIWHHALADGTSALLFHETFLAGMNAVQTADNVDPVVKAPHQALLPPFEELHPMPISWYFFIKTILNTLLAPVYAITSEKLWTGSPVPEDIAVLPKPRFLTVVLSNEITTKLVQVCREEKTSVTATLQCLLAASLFASLPAEECKRLRVDGPISARRFLNIEKEQMTSAITQYEFFHDRPTSTDNSATDILQNFSWETSRAVKSTIAAELAKSGTDNPVALLKYVSSMPQFLLGMLGKPRKPTAELSNVGVWPNGKDEENVWRVGRMVFSQSPNVVASAFALSVVTGADGNATLNLSWPEGAVEDELMREVAHCVRDGIGRLVKRDG
ncbi:alcohol acetyltransferase [Bipolaris maydis]|nr:alcohol acetyltransferase [Bipolaris maydis]